MSRFRKLAELRQKMLKLAHAVRAPQVRLVGWMLFLALTLATVSGNAVGGEVVKVVYTTTPYTLKGYLSRPSGPGPFSAVVYNHGGNGNIIAGAPKETCEALAAAGFVGFAPIRRPTPAMSMDGQSDDVQAGLDYLLGLDYVDRNRVAMAGFSRGGVLTFMAAAQGAPIKAAIIMASAPPPSGFTFGDAVKIRVPVLLLVAMNDTGSRKTMGNNTFEIMQRMSAALTDAGNTPKLIVYPSYGGDGHEMFFEIGTYWKDVVEFLKLHL